MRYLTIPATILIALVTLSSHEAAAYAPPPHGHWGGWYGGYGYYAPVVPYVVQRPIFENPTFSGLPIKITNPAANGVTLSYTLNGFAYSIPPGSTQDLTHDRSWVVAFSRGGPFGEARYGLEPGLYSFANTDHGWELYRGALAQPSVAPAPSMPTNPTPPATMPVAPPPQTPAAPVPNAAPMPPPTH